MNQFLFIVYILDVFILNQVFFQNKNIIFFLLGYSEDSLQIDFFG